MACKRLVDRDFRFADACNGESAVRRGRSMTDVAVRQAVSSPSIMASIRGKLVAFCAIAIYALVALGLRLVMARVFFLSGQAKIEGPSVLIHLNVPALDFSVTLPAQIKGAAFQMFESQFADLPVPPAVAGVIFAYAEFVLPICLVLGFATRFAALGLLVMTLLLQVYVLPAMWWSAHVYWVSILAVLVCVGPGAISIDALIRVVYRWDRRPV
jgi:putative oxidoreductase